MLNFCQGSNSRLFWINVEVLISHSKSTLSLEKKPFDIDETCIENELVSIFEDIDLQLNCAINFAPVEIKKPIEVNRFGFELVGICKGDFEVGFFFGYRF